MSETKKKIHEEVVNDPLFKKIHENLIPKDQKDVLESLERFVEIIAVPLVDDLKTVLESPEAQAELKKRLSNIGYTGVVKK